MVRGLARFRDHFGNFTDRYILIGGTACDLAYTEAGLEFRATRDLDVVLTVESLDAAFGRAFWAFIKAGAYQSQEASAGRARRYRFQKPGSKDFPDMIELFAREPDPLGTFAGGHLTRLPLSDEVSSLSAILLDDDAYSWIQSGRREIDGVPIVRAEHLIPLKAAAWLDLTLRSASGQRIDSRDIRKHLNDVFRLFAIIDPDYRATLPLPMRESMRTFLDATTSERLDLKSLRIGLSLEAILARLRELYIPDDTDAAN